MMKGRVLIVEDEPIIAEDIAQYLEQANYGVFDICYDMGAAIKALEEGKPDLAIVDINLGNNMDGLELAAHIYKNCDFPFVYLTSYSSSSVLEKAKKTHPMGYIVKPFDESDLFSTLEIALYNYRKSPANKTLNLDFLNQKLDNTITPREFEILKDIYEGRTNREIAEAHFVSINTIKTHIQSLYDKLDTHSRAQTIAYLRELLGQPS